MSHAEALIRILEELDRRNAEITCGRCGRVWPPCECPTQVGAQTTCPPRPAGAGLGIEGVA